MYQQNSRYITLQGERVNDWEDTNESAVAQFMVLRRDLPGMAAEKHHNSKEKRVLGPRHSWTQRPKIKFLHINWTYTLKFC